jgi:hypothetical protein
MRVSKSKAKIRKEEKLVRKPLKKPAPEELKSQKIAKVHIPQVDPAPTNLNDDPSIYFGGSKTLRTPAHRKMVIKFVRDQFPRSIFQRIYDAETDGWKNTDFHRCCDMKGWTLTIVETTKGFIFGGFTTAEWNTSSYYKSSAHSFLFSVN